MTYLRRSRSTSVFPDIPQPMLRMSLSWIMLWLLLFTSPRPSAGAEPEKRDGTLDPATQTRTYAVLQNFRKRLAGRSFKLDESAVRRLVIRELRANPKDAPHQRVTRDQVDDALTATFKTAFDDTLKAAIKDVDPGDKLDLYGRLKQELSGKRNNSWESDARARYDEFLSEGFPVVLRRTQDRMIAQQAETLRDSLKQYLRESDRLTAAQIEEAYRADDLSSLSAGVRDGVLLMQDESWRKLRFAEAVQKFDADTRRLVNDGVGQLKDQRAALSVELSSYTLEGKRKELEAHLKETCREQAERAAASPFSKAFGLFPSVKSQIEPTVRRQLDGQIGTAVDRLIKQLRGGKRSVPAENVAAIRAAILGDVSHHATIVDSRRLLDEEFKRMATESATWIIEYLSAEAERSQSPHDETSPSAIERFERDVQHRLATRDTAAADAFRRMKSSVQAIYSETVLAEVRGEIAMSQARKKGPRLGDWRPTSREIVRWGGVEITRQVLRQLDVWNGEPPRSGSVLEETWRIWQDQAADAIAVGKQALLGQQNVVKQLTPEISRKVENAPNEGMSHWFEVFHAEAEREWQARRSAAARQYPRLFGVVEKQIEGIVSSLLNDLARSTQYALIDKHTPGLKARIADDARLGRTPTFEPHYAWMVGKVRAGWVQWMAEHPQWVKDHPELARRQSLLKKSTDAIDGLVRRLLEAEFKSMKQRREKIERLVREAARGNVASSEAETRQVLQRQVEKAGIELTRDERIEFIEERAQILFRQNELVSRVTPQFSRRIETEAVAGRAPDEKVWREAFTGRVEDLWSRDELASRFPAVLPSVHDRIRGVVAELLKLAAPEPTLVASGKRVDRDDQREQTGNASGENDRASTAGQGTSANGARQGAGGATGGRGPHGTGDRGVGNDGSGGEGGNDGRGAGTDGLQEENVCPRCGHPLADSSHSHGSRDGAQERGSESPASNSEIGGGLETRGGKDQGREPGEGGAGQAGTQDKGDAALSQLDIAYRIGFWLLLLLLLLLLALWYFNFRTVSEYARFRRLRAALGDTPEEQARRLELLLAFLDSQGPAALERLLTENDGRAESPAFASPVKSTV